MKVLWCVVVCGIASSLSSSTVRTPEAEIADKDFLERQWKVLELLKGLEFNAPLDFDTNDLNMAEHTDSFTGSN